MSASHSLGQALLNLGNRGFSDPRLRQIIEHAAMAELTKRAAPPAIGKPGAGMALLRQAARQSAKGKTR